MSNIIRNVVMLPFLLILVASLASGFQYSNQSFGTETDESRDTSEARSQGSLETQSEEGSATSNTSGTETDESADTSSMKTSKNTNVTSGGKPPGQSEKTFSESLGITIKVPLNAITCSGTANFATAKIQCVGTDGNDNMTGDNGINNMRGKKGNDLMSGRGSGDHLLGDEGNDRMYGQRGNDVMYGSEGDDRMYGDVGNDVMYGNLGADTIEGGIGDDKIYQDSDKNPTFPDRSKDIIDCGPGNDEAWLSRQYTDVAVNCETVHFNVTTRVTFNSITVLKNHEGFPKGDGEFVLVAYVQGKKVDLTAASGPGAGLNDVSDGETLTFKPGTRAYTEIPNNLPLSIFTVGHELDACDNYGFRDNIHDPYLIKRIPIVSGPQQASWGSAT